MDTEDKNLGDTSHLNATLSRGWQGTATLVCGGCSKSFPAVKHPIEDLWDSPEWEKHARDMQNLGRGRRVT
jgi:hypothetical protein